LPQIDFTQLAGWDQEDALAALAGLRAGCRAAKAVELSGICQALAGQAPADAAAARHFFETRFEIVPVETPGLLTGYFSEHGPPIWWCRSLRQARQPPW
jgi:membrane-bound lytic murein transglycosylase